MATLNTELIIASQAWDQSGNGTVLNAAKANVAAWLGTTGASDPDMTARARARSLGTAAGAACNTVAYPIAVPALIILFCGAGALNPAVAACTSAYVMAILAMRVTVTDLKSGAEVRVMRAFGGAAELYYNIGNGAGAGAGADYLAWSWPFHSRHWMPVLVGCAVAMAVLGWESFAVIALAHGPDDVVCWAKKCRRHGAEWRVAGTGVGGFGLTPGHGKYHVIAGVVGLPTNGEWTYIIAFIGWGGTFLDPVNFAHFNVWTGRTVSFTPGDQSLASCRERIVKHKANYF